MSEFQNDWIAVTGHRPERLGGYSREAEDRRVDFAMQILEETGPRGVIVGMAQGWDMAVAEACALLCIPFKAYVPFEGQEKIWPAATQALYRNLLTAAEEVFYVSPRGYGLEKLKARNIAMVDAEEVTTIFALWSGEPGGTAHCVRYAQTIAGKPVINFWTRWING